MWRRKQTAKKARGTAVAWTTPDAEQKVAVLKKATASAKRRPNIDWKDAPKGATCARQVFPSTYKQPPNVDPSIAERFVLGAPVMASRDLGLSIDRGVYRFAPLEAYFGPEEQTHIPRGALLTYTGPVYETERQYADGRWIDVSVIKHTFITPLGRCIIHDFNLIELL